MWITLSLNAANADVNKRYFYTLLNLLNFCVTITLHRVGLKFLCANVGITNLAYYHISVVYATHAFIKKVRCKWGRRPG